MRGNVRPLHPQGQDQGHVRRRLASNPSRRGRTRRNRSAGLRPQGFLACTQSSKPCGQAAEPRAQGSPPGARASEPRPRSQGALRPEYRAPWASQRWATVHPFRPCPARSASIARMNTMGPGGTGGHGAPRIPLRSLRAMDAGGRSRDHDSLKVQRSGASPVPCPNPGSDGQIVHSLTPLEWLDRVRCSSRLPGRVDDIVSSRYPHRFQPVSHRPMAAR